MNDVMERLGNALEGRYRIERELGQGGMATVYLAADIKHDRKVALKVLKPELAAVLGAERFVVEIKTTASLQHPHILPLFDSGEAGGFLFYVMPFIDGETLRSKLDRETQFGIEEAIRITTSLADALDYAHRHGVIHRDIKPENILLHDGRPMVADFGIALALSAAAGGRMTETGLSLGTPHYMSPEQATAAKEISGRSDIYSLASVLYEMLTGEPPHMGKSAQQIIMKIITETPQPITELRKSVPAHVASAVAQALEKLPADRFASAAEFAAALEGRIASRTTTLLTAVGGASRHSHWRRIAIAAGGTAVAFAMLAGWSMTRVPELPVTRLSISFPEHQRLLSASTKRFDISPDGKRIVYVGSGGESNAQVQLWVRELDALTARPLPGTVGALAPFFSPDGEMVAFLTGIVGDLRVTPIDGRPSMTLVSDSAAGWGGDWGTDGYIYFTHSSSVIARVPASGGQVEKMTVLDSATKQNEHDWVDLLPGNKGAVVQVWRTSIGDAFIGALDLKAGTVRRLFDGIHARYLPTGHLVYSTFSGALFVVPFDAERMVVTGAAVAIAEGIQVDANSGVAQFAVSNTGTLLYMPGGGAGSEQIVWVDRKGVHTPVDSAWRGSYSNVALSPDGRSVAVSSVAADGEHIWVKQLPAGPLTRLTVGSSANSRPVWAPDGRRVAYVSNRSGGRNLWIQRADGGSPAESLYANTRQVDEVSWAPDGKTLVVRIGSGGVGTRDIVSITTGADTPPRPLVATRFDEFGTDLSPDGRWLAYVSNEAGRNEVYVRDMRDPDEDRYQVSVDGGGEPRWSRNGREIFFRSGRGEMLAADIVAGTRFGISNRRILFRKPNMGADVNHSAYDTSLDGSRFLMINRSLSENSELVIVLNWFEELNKRSRGAKR